MLPWIKAIPYLVAGLAAAAVVLRRRRAGDARAWAVVATVLLGIGLVRGVGLQQAVAEAVRSAVRDGGWYADRRPVQAVAVGVIGAVAVAGCLLVIGRKRPAGSATTALSVAIGLLVVAAAVRVVSLHQADHFVGLPGGARLSASALLDLLALAIVGVQAWKALRRGPATRRVDRPERAP